jgi:hypothetical protein
LVSPYWASASAAIAHRQAIVWLEKGCSAIPAVPFHHSWLASAYALKGETERAAAELAETRRLAGDGSFSSIARVKEGGSWQVPKTRAIAETIYFGSRRHWSPDHGPEDGLLERGEQG